MEGTKAEYTPVMRQANALMPTGEDTLKVMICMDFIMGAVLQARLAAFMTVFELTSSPGLVVLIIIIANRAAD